MKILLTILAIYLFLYSNNLKAIEGNYHATKINNVGTLYLDLVDPKRSIYISEEFPQIRLLNYTENNCSTISFATGTFIQTCVTNEDIKTIRYSSLTNITESIDLKKPYKKWEIEYTEKVIIKSYFKYLRKAKKRLENQVNITPNHNTKWNIKGIVARSEPSQSSSCSYEYYKLKEEGYGGYPTFKGCINVADNRLAASAIGDAAACLTPGANLLTCGLAITNHMLAIEAYKETEMRCHQSYTNALRTYNKCLDEEDQNLENDGSTSSQAGANVNNGSHGNDPGVSGGGGGPGSSGGSTQYCYRTINEGSIHEKDIQVPCN